jgi:hypothetical protein
MIIYNQAFDLYHTVYRILQLLSNFDGDEYLELERLRIWDFYLLFPSKIIELKPKRNEKDFKKILKQFTVLENNPYEIVYDNRKVFEKIKPYQISALNCLVSYGIIDKELLLLNRVSIVSKDLLFEYAKNLEKLSAREQNIITILTSDFYQITMFGKGGFKERTNLLESKYDAR